MVIFSQLSKTFKIFGKNYVKQEAMENFVFPDEI